MKINEGSNPHLDTVAHLYNIHNVFENEFIKTKLHLQHWEKQVGGKKYMNTSEITNELNISISVLRNILNHTTKSGQRYDIIRYFINDELTKINNAIMQTKANNLNWF